MYIAQRAIVSKLLAGLYSEFSDLYAFMLLFSLQFSLVYAPWLYSIIEYEEIEEEGLLSPAAGPARHVVLCGHRSVFSSPLGGECFASSHFSTNPPGIYSYSMIL
jgi:hypothetical protein